MMRKSVSYTKVRGILGYLNPLSSPRAFISFLYLHSLAIDRHFYSLVPISLMRVDALLPSEFQEYC